MNPAAARRLRLAQEELDAVRSLIAGGHGRQAVSRAYYATFYAADAALASLDLARSKHSAVMAAFNRFVVKEGGLDPDVGRTLRRLFDLRAGADYDIDSELTANLDNVLAEATRFVAAVAEWLER